MKKIKVVLVQNILAPYRIPLFKNISADKDIDFTLTLHARSEPHRNQKWAVDKTKKYPFPIKIVSAFKIKKKGNNIYDPTIYFSPALFLYLILKSPDIIICNGFSPSTLIVYYYCKIFKKKYIIWNEGIAINDSNIKPSRLALRKKMTAASNAFIVAGTLAKDYISKNLGGTASFYISHNCNDTTYITKTLQPEKKKSGKGNLFVAGSLVELKGIRQVLYAYKQLKKENDSYTLSILGEGPLRSELEEYVNKHNLSNVSFLGFIPFEQSLSYWKKADMLLQLSFSDYNPLVITEALAAGLPIISSHYVGSHPDFVHEGKNGYVVDPKNTTQVVTAIKNCLLNNKSGAMSRYSLQLSKNATYESAVKGFTDAIFFTNNSK